MIMKVTEREIFRLMMQNINQFDHRSLSLLTSFFNKSTSQISLMSCDLAVEYDETVFVTFDDAEDA